MKRKNLKKNLNKQEDKMDKTLSVAFMVLFLLVGVLGGYVLTPEKTVTNTVTDVVYQNVTVEKLVEVPAPDLLSLAVGTFMTAVEDESVNDSKVDVLSNFTNGSYDIDEVEPSRVYNDYSVEYNNDKTTVNFRVKLRFDEDGEASEKKTFDVTVIYEDGEDTEVIVA